MGVVDVQLDRSEEVLHARGCGIAPIDQVLVPPPNHHLQVAQKLTFKSLVDLWEVQVAMVCIFQPPYRLLRLEWAHSVLHHSYNEPIRRMLKTYWCVYLSRDGNLIVRLVSQWALLLVSVVKSDGHCSLCDTCLTTFVHQLLQGTGTDLQGQGT